MIQAGVNRHKLGQGCGVCCPTLCEGSKTPSFWLFCTCHVEPQISQSSPWESTFFPQHLQNNNPSLLYSPYLPYLSTC